MTDFDNDALNALVLYSHDNGDTWFTVGNETNSTTANIDLSMLPGGTQCLVKVVTSDGLNTGTGSSMLSQVATKEPMLGIASPREGETIYTDTEIEFLASAFDLEGELTSYQWTSNIDGTIGEGEEFETQLCIGTHLITLRVTDTDGHNVETTISVIVKDKPQIELTNLVLSKGITD